MGASWFDEGKRCLILADWLDGMSAKQIQHKYGCGYSYARTLAARSGFKKLRPSKKKQVKRDWLFVATKIKGTHDHASS